MNTYSLAFCVLNQNCPGCGPVGAFSLMLAASLAQFKLHRDNPSEVKLKVPVTLLVLGAILLGLSYLPSPF